MPLAFTCLSTLGSNPPGSTNLCTYRVLKYTLTWPSLFWETSLYTSLIWYMAGIYLSTSTISVFLCQLSLSLEPGYVLQTLTMAAVLMVIRSLL